MAVAPLAVPQFDALLGVGLVIFGCLVALGIVLVLHGFARAVVGGIGGILGKVPYLGTVLASPVNKVFHWMNHEFAAAEQFLDGMIGWYWHEAGRLVHYLAHEIEGLGHIAWTITKWSVGVGEIQYLAKLIGNVRGEVHAVERAARWALHRIAAVEHGLKAKLLAVVLPLLRPLEHAIGVSIPHDIRALRERARTLTRRLDNLWHAIRRLDALLGVAALTGAVAIALDRLGLSWIKCRNTKSLGRGICGLPSALLEGLLAGAIDALVVTDLCDLSYLMTLTAEQLGPAFLEWVDVEEALVGCHGNSAPPALHLPALDLPPLEQPRLLAA